MLENILNKLRKAFYKPFEKHRLISDGIEYRIMHIGKKRSLFDPDDKEVYGGMHDWISDFVTDSQNNTYLKARDNGKLGLFAKDGSRVADTIGEINNRILPIKNALQDMPDLIPTFEDNYRIIKGLLCHEDDETKEKYLNKYCQLIQKKVELGYNKTKTVLEIINKQVSNPHKMLEMVTT